MDRPSWIYALACMLLALPRLGLGYIPIDWNTTQYFGPDGPWQGVVAAISGAARSVHTQSVTLYPWSSIGMPLLLTTDTCNLPDADATCGAGGLVEAEASQGIGLTTGLFGPSNGYATGYQRTYDGKTTPSEF
jgi:hypothetical protein